MSGLDTSQDVTTQEVFDNEHDHVDAQTHAEHRVESTPKQVATQPPGDDI